MKAKDQLKAKDLRLKGYSLKEISELLSVSKSSVSLWVRNVELSVKAKDILFSKYTAGQRASQVTIRNQTLVKETEAKSIALEILKKYLPNPEVLKILCALVYYCEGNKSINDGVRFTNSDPLLVTTFLKLFRSSFKLDESKLRCCVHLHNYHDKDAQLKFWSKVARIPLNQFIKPYSKKNSGLYKKVGYQGCISIRYADVKIARELKALAVEFMNKGL